MREAGASNMTDRIATYVWKAAVYPLIRDMVIRVVTTGDFKITWDDLKTWLVRDLVFQTFNAIFEEFTGFNLCARISGNIRIALLNASLTEYVPDCTFDQSEMGQMVERVLTGETGAWEELKAKYYRDFSFSLYSSSNDFYSWYELRDNFESQKEQKEQELKFEMLINDGFLGTRNCTDEQKQNGNCPVVSPGTYVANLFKETYTAPFDSALGAQMWNDMASLGGVITDILKNRLVNNIYTSI